MTTDQTPAEGSRVVVGVDGSGQVASLPCSSQPLQDAIGEAATGASTTAASVVRLPPGVPRDLGGLDREMTRATYSVDGMTRGDCIADVMERIRLLPGVSGVAARFVPNGPSPLVIRSRVDLPPELVRETVEMVGFHASGTSPHRARHLRQVFDG